MGKKSTKKKSEKETKISKMKTNAIITQILCRFFKNKDLFNDIKPALLKINNFTFEKSQAIMLSPRGLFYFIRSYIINTDCYSEDKNDLLRKIELIEKDLFKINFILIYYLKHDTINFIRNEKIENYVVTYLKDLMKIKQLDDIFIFLIKKHYTINQLFLFSPFHPSQGRSYFWSKIYIKHTKLIYNKLWGKDK